MKKSRIIIPALALIALSTVASVTGTVAWFTATRSVQITAGNFAVTKTSSNLAVNVTGGTYTSASNGAVTVANKTILTHGSFNHLAKNFYVPNVTADAVTEVALYSSGTTIASGLADDLLQSTDDSGNSIVTAVTWHMTLSVAFADSGRDMALYLDLATSWAHLLNGNDPEHTGTGFRVAFVAEPATTSTSAATTSTGATKVWAPHQTSSASKYVANTSNMQAGTAYTTGALIHSGSNYTVPNDEGATASEAAAIEGYLGTFEFIANTTVTLPFTVVAWYEGTDPNITNNETVMETLNTQIGFKASTLKDTPVTPNP